VPWDGRYPSEHLVLIRGIGVFDIHFATSFGKAMRAEGGVGFCKLFDLSRVDIKLSNHDMESMVASTRLEAHPVRADRHVFGKDAAASPGGHGGNHEGAHRKPSPYPPLHRRDSCETVAREEGPVVNPSHEVFQRPSGDGQNRV